MSIKIPKGYQIDEQCYNKDEVLTYVVAHKLTASGVKYFLFKPNANGEFKQVSQASSPVKFHSTIWGTGRIK